MDTLKAVLAHPSQGSGLVQAPPKKDEDSGESVNAVATSAISTRSHEQTDPVNKQQITNAVKDINNFFQATQRSVEFSLDETSGHMVMQIRDTKTNEVIRQIPGEDALKLAKQLDEVAGILFKARA